MARDTPPGMGAPEDIVGEYAVGVSFSGGELRAAAFAHGVLKALEGSGIAAGCGRRMSCGRGDRRGHREGARRATLVLPRLREFIQERKP
jgi:hypothetical protein